MRIVTSSAASFPRSQRMSAARREPPRASRSTWTSIPVEADLRAEEGAESDQQRERRELEAMLIRCSPALHPPLHLA